MPRVIQCAEHDTLLVGESADARITELQVAEILRVQGAVGALSWIDRNRVRTSEHVGVIVGPHVRLEILPKIDGFGENAARRTLIRMLAQVWDIPIHSGQLASLESQKRDLLEIVIHLFALRLGNEVRRGVVRAYEQHRDDLPRLRGKLDPIRQYSRNAAYPHRLACAFDDLTANTPLNRLLLCTVHVLQRMTGLSTTEQLLREISSHFENVLLVSAEIALRDRVVISAAEGRWRPVATLARLLLERTYQTTHLGFHSGIALLFDMNLLFESYVTGLVRKVAHGQGHRLTTQGPYRALVRDDSAVDLIYTRPDMHIDVRGDTVILDTKWKQLEAKSGLGIGASDFYQMHAYQRTYSACKTVLIFPQAPALGGKSFPLNWTFVESSASLSVLGIDLEDPATFVKQISTMLGAVGQSVSG